MAAAKKGGKKKVTKKSSEKPEKENKEKSSAQIKKKPAAKKKGKFECQHCGKVVSNAHNLKVHEQHCKKKIGKKEEKAKGNEIEVAVRRLKDEFEDQRDALQKETAEREDILRDEIRELKEVLRLEIQRTHHMTPPEPKSLQLEPASVPGHPTEEKEAEPQSGPQRAPGEPALQAEHGPEPVPSPPSIAKTPEVDKAGHGPKVEHLDDVLAGGPAEEKKAETVIKTAPEPVHKPVEKDEEIVAEPVSLPAAVSGDEIAELIRAELANLDMSKVASASLQESVMFEDFTTRLDAISNELSRLSRETNEKYDTLSGKIDERLQELDVKRYERELEKVSARVFDIMDEVGFGESLDVSKIPPNILEIVYRATLEDAVREMVHSLGNQEAERKINQALEEVRLKTSGSELFRFDGRRIVTENLARSLESNMISAKQIQTTYRELLNKLLDNVPHYKPKNFRAMIKIKSQEYAVDKATVLMVEMGRLSNFAETTSHMIAALSSQLNSRAVQMEKGFSEVKTAIEAKIDQDELLSINNKIQDRVQAEGKLSENLGMLKAEVEMLRKVIDDFEKKEEKPVKEPEDKKPAGVKDEKAEEKESGKKEEKSGEDKPEKKGTPAPVEEKVLAEIAKGASSKTAVMKASGLSKDEVEKSLAKLVKDKKIVKKGPKNRPTYSTPEADFEKVVKKETQKKPPSKKKTEEKESPPKEDGAPAEKKPSKKEPKAKKDSKKASKKGSERDEPKDSESTKKKESKKDKKEEKPSEDVKEKPPEKVKEEPKEEAPRDKKDEMKAPEEDEKESKEEVSEEKKELKDLTEEEKIVYGSITGSGITLPNLRKNVEKDVKYTIVLRALRILIDSELIEVKTRGRHTLYHRIKVAKPGKNEKNKKKKEVK